MSKEPERDPILAVVLVIVGTLILALSGTCTLGVAGFNGRPGAPSNMSALPIALVFGGPFLALGAASAWIGLNKLIDWRNKAPAMAGAVGITFMIIGSLGALVSGVLMVARPSVPIALCVAASVVLIWIGDRTSKLR